MKILIKRYVEGKYRDEVYELDIKENWTVLDVLNYIKENIDESLSYRVMCRSSVCGTCAVKVNGRHVLACKEKATSLGNSLIIEHVDNLKPIRDLVVDHNPVERNLRRGGVWFNEKYYKGPLCKEKLNKVEKQWDCIACLICEAVCPVFSEKFGGPYVFTRIYRIEEDPRKGSINIFENIINMLNIEMCIHCNYCSIYCPKSCMPEFAIRFLKNKFNIKQEIGDNLDFLSF